MKIKQAETDEILPVTKYFIDSGEVLVRCPHCRRIVGLQSGDFKGEMFYDRLCNGNYEVLTTAKRITNPDNL